MGSIYPTLELGANLLQKKSFNHEMAKGSKQKVNDPTVRNRVCFAKKKNTESYIAFDLSYLTHVMVKIRETSVN
jgi:hypothetical protein